MECTVGVDEDRETQENLSAMAASPEKADWTFTLITDKVYVGKGKPVGDIQVDKNVNTMTLKVSGGGLAELS